MWCSWSEWTISMWPGPHRIPLVATLQIRNIGGTTEHHRLKSCRVAYQYRIPRVMAWPEEETYRKRHNPEDKLRPPLYSTSSETLCGRYLQSERSSFHDCLLRFEPFRLRSWSGTTLGAGRHLIKPILRVVGPNSCGGQI